MSRNDTAGRVISASPDRVFATLTDPDALCRARLRNALTRELERTRVAQLMWCEPAPDARLGRQPPELAADGSA
jgi:hypothetical protein